MGKRHKSKRQPKGTGQPDPTKDRSVHVAARGKKLVSLSDLSREEPSDKDLENYTTYLIEESDRGAAVMAAALVEKALEDAIRSRLADPGEGIADSWFEGINAPFRSFSAKIALGRALAIYGDVMEGKLIIVKNVRNAFAHRMIPLSFEHPTLQDACRKLSYVQDPTEKNARIVFGAVCVTLAHALGTYGNEKGHELVTITFP